MKSKKIDLTEKYPDCKVLIAMLAVLLDNFKIKAAEETYDLILNIMDGSFCCVCRDPIEICQCDPEERDPEYEAERADRMYEEWRDRQMDGF